MFPLVFKMAFDHCMKMANFQFRFEIGAIITFWLLSASCVLPLPTVRDRRLRKF
jgi:hypothetical protein